MSKLIKNWTYLLISDISQSVISFFVFMILARKLSPEGYGEFNIILSVVAIFTVFANNVSCNQVIIREVTLRPKSTHHIFLVSSNLRIIGYTLTSISIIVYLLLNQTNNSVVIIFSVIFLLSNSLWDLAESIAFGHFVTKFSTVFQLSFSLIWLFIVILLLDNGTSSTLVFSLYASIYTIRSIVYLIFVWKRFVVNAKEAIKIGIISILQMSLPYLGIRILGSFSEQIPILILGHNAGNEEVGYYSVGLRLIIPITLAINTGLRAIFPFLTKLFKENKDQFERLLIQGFGFVLIWGSIIAAILSVTSTYWIPVLLGNEYASSNDTFNFLAWFGVGLCFDLVLSVTLSSTYKQNILAIITVIDFIIIFPMLYYGSKYGASGLALAKLAGTLLLIGYHIVVIKKVLKINIHQFNFYASLLFFLLLLIISCFVSLPLLKISLILLVITVYIVYKKSPLRENYLYIMNKLKNQKTNEY